MFDSVFPSFEEIPSCEAAHSHLHDICCCIYGYTDILWVQDRYSKAQPIWPRTFLFEFVVASTCTYHIYSLLVFFNSLIIASNKFVSQITVILKQLDLASSGKGGIGNFIGIGAIAGSFGVADAVLQGGMVGDLFFMCPEFLQVSLFSTFHSMLVDFHMHP